MKSALCLVSVVSIALLACSKDKAEKGGDDNQSTKAVDPKPVPAVGKPDKTKPPHGGAIMDLMQVSQQKLDIDPPVTVAKHLTDTLAKVKKTPKVTCEPAEGSQWQCQVWPGDEFGYFYTAKFDANNNNWRMVEGSAELSPDD